MNTFTYMYMHICKGIHPIHPSFMHAIHRPCIDDTDDTIHRFMHHRKICIYAYVCVYMCTTRDHADGSTE